MIVLIIKLRETEQGVHYECNPSKETTKDYTHAETVVAKIVMLGVHEAMVKAAEDMGVPITTLSVDGKQRKK